MPLIKNITAISYSSQDPKHPLSALLKGTGAWLCSPDDRSGRLSADLQLDRALTISYVDVGNHNSVTLSIEVSRSCSSSGTTCALLPTVALMTPQEFRGQHPNCKAVRMFKTEDLDKRALKEQWDRVRITCCQPFKRGVQFGLSFFKLYTSEVLQPITLQAPLSSTLVSPSLSASLPDSASSPANIAASALHHLTDGDQCVAPSYECNKKNSFGKPVLSDENILQRLKNSSPRNFSFKKNVPLVPGGFDQVKNSSKCSQSLANNLQNKTVSQQNSSHTSQMKENNARETGKTLKNISASSQSAAQRFRSALDKLCNNQAGVSPTAVAKQNFLKKFGSSTAGGSSSGGSDGSPALQTNRTESIGAPSGAGAAAGNPKTEFEYEALEFLISLDLQQDQILQLKVADVRVHFEAQRGEPLSRPERLCFKNLALDFCARRLDTLDSQSQSAAFARPQPPPAAVTADASGGRRSSCGTSDTPGPGRQGGSSREVDNWDLGVPKERSNVGNVSRTDSGRKFNFKKLELVSPSTSQSSPLSGGKHQRFNRSVSKSPMPFYEGYDDSQAHVAAGELEGGATKNISKGSPRGGCAKKRKKEEPKPVANGVWVQSKKVRTRVSNSPRNIPRKEADNDDVVEIVELDDAIDDCNERHTPNKTLNDSPFQQNGGWLKTPKTYAKHKNTARGISLEKSKLAFIGDASNEDPINTNQQANYYPATNGSSPCLRSTDPGSCERATDLPSSGSAVVSSTGPHFDGELLGDDSCIGQRRSGETQTGVGKGVRLGAAPVNKFGLRAPPLPQQEKEVEGESVECPLCSRLFPSSLIQEHAATCGQSDTLRATDAPAAVSRDAGTANQDCPVCSERLREEDYEQHVLDCADRHF